MFFYSNLQQDGSFYFLCLEITYIYMYIYANVPYLAKQRFSLKFICINVCSLEAKRCYIVLPSRSLCSFLEPGICQHITWPLADLVFPGPY